MGSEQIEIIEYIKRLDDKELKNFVEERIEFLEEDEYGMYPDTIGYVVDYNPESIIQKYIMDLRGDCHVSFDRFFTSDNLNHWVYKLSFSKSLW